MADRTWIADKLKFELYQLNKLHKPAPKYVVDGMALEHGFVVVRLPSYYSVLNPVKLIWAWVKTTVVKKNNTFKIVDVKQLKEEALV